MDLPGGKGSCTARIWKTVNKSRCTRPTFVLACRADHGFRCHRQHVFKNFVAIKKKDSRAEGHVMRFGLVDTVAFVRDSIDPAVLGSTANAAFKLFLICGIVRWLSESGRIAENTSVVLAQVGFTSRNLV